MPDGDGMRRRDNEGLASSFFAKRDRKCSQKGEGGPSTRGACPSQLRLRALRRKQISDKLSSEKGRHSA